MEHNMTQYYNMTRPSIITWSESSDLANWHSCCWKHWS